MPFKPDTYPSVAPYLVVEGAQATLDFLVTVFDAVPLRLHPGAHGRLGHAEVRIDDTVVMLGDAMPGWPAVPAHVHVYVADVDAIWTRAIRGRTQGDCNEAEGNRRRTGAGSGGGRHGGCE